MWGYRLGIHDKNINFKKYLIIISAWALYSRTPWLTAMSWEYFSPHVSPQSINQVTIINPFLIILFYLLTVVIIIIGYSMSYFIFYKFLQSKKLLLSATAVVMVTMVGEILRSLVFSVFMWGSESSIGLSDTTNSISNALVLTPLVRLAYFGHIYYLTFILMSLIVGAFYFLLKIYKHNPRLSKIQIIKALLPLFLITILITLQFLYLEVMGIQYHKREVIVGGHEWPVTNIKFLAEGVATATPSISRSPTIQKASTTQNILINYLVYASNTDTHITQNINKLLSTSYYIDNENQIVYKRSKQNLYPFYEYSPYILDFYYYLFGYTKKPLPIYNIKESKDINDFYFYKTETSNDKIKKETIYKWQAIICSEHYSYSFMKKIKVRDYDFVVIQSSLSAWKGSDWLYANFVINQKINAAYLAIPYIVVTKDGPSFEIYP